MHKVIFFIVFFAGAETFDEFAYDMGDDYEDNFVGLQSDLLEDLLQSTGDLDRLLDMLETTDNPDEITFKGRPEIDVDLVWLIKKYLKKRDCNETAEPHEFFKSNTNSLILDPCQPNKSRELARVEGADEIYSAYLKVSGLPVNVTGYYHFWLFSNAEQFADSPLIVVLLPTPHSSLLAHFLINESLSDLFNYNHLFIEYACEFGYSFCEPSIPQYARPFESAFNVYRVLEDFYAIFPQFRNVHLYFTGEYEAGKVAEIIVFLSSLNTTIAPRIESLKGAVITHGAVDTDLMINYAPIWTQLGIIDLKEAGVIDYHTSLGLAAIKTDQHDDIEYFITHFLYKKLNEVMQMTETEEEVTAEMFKLSTGPLIRNRFLSKYHIGNVTYRRHIPIFVRSSIQGKIRLSKILTNYKILYCNGQLDQIYTYGMTTEYLDRVEWPHNDRWYHQPTRLWKDENDNLIGHWKNYTNLHQVLIRNVGRSLSVIRPKIFLQMLQYFVEDRIPTCCD